MHIRTSAIVACIIAFTLQARCQFIFQERFGGAQADVPQCSALTNNGYIIGGYTNSYGAGQRDMLVVRLNVCGQVIWAKTYGTTLDDECSYILPTSDGGFLLTGYTKGAGYGNKDVMAVKLDSLGNIIWSNVYGGTSDDFGNFLMDTPTGYYIAANSTSAGFGANDSYIISIRKNGVFKWSKLYGGGNQDSGCSLLTAPDGNIIISGATMSYSTGMHDAYLMKTDTSGNMLWFKSYGGVNYEGAFVSCPALNGGYMLAGYTDSYGAGGENFFVFKTDLSGNLSWAKTYGGSSNEGCFRILPTLNSNGYWLQGYTNSYGFGSSDLCVIKIDIAGNVKFARTYGSSGQEGGVFAHGLHPGLVRTNDLGCFIAEYTSGFGSLNNDIYLIKCDSTGNSGCNQITFSPTVTSPSVTTINTTFTPIIKTANMAVTLTASNISLPQYNLCNAIMPILGSDTTLCSNSTVNLDAGPGFSQYVWNTGATTQMITADSAMVYMVTATNAQGCWLTDSIAVIILPPFAVDLGPDTSMCTGTTINISPGAGYTTYHWSGGSTASNINVSTAGVFSVTVTNSDGCTAMDSLTVSIIPFIPGFDLGNDTSMCTGDSILLDAGAGYNSYLWNDGSTAQTIYVSDSGVYYATVNKTGFCPVSDTIRLFLLPLPSPVFLGNDTSLCSGDTIILNAGGPYTGYLWQDGGTSQTHAATQTNLYSVTATDICGIVTDSISIVVHALPQINLGPDVNLCPDSSVTFDAGSGYFSYVWQDLSALQYFTANLQGTYYVSVTDSNGCGASDTAVVFMLTHIQGYILGNDTSFCEDDTLLIAAGLGYDSYLWQDGSTIQSFAATDSGMYYVLVTDSGYCPTADTLLLTVVPLPQDIALGNDTSYCSGNPITLDAGAGYAGYVWQDGSTSQTYLADTTNLYSVTATAQCGSVTDSIMITVNPIPQVSLGADTYICEGTPVILDAGAGFVSYLWQDNTTQQTYTASQAGTYSVTVGDANGCNGTDQINLTLVQLPAVDLGPDGDMCDQEEVVLDAGSWISNQQYIWQDGSILPTYSVTGGGSYSVTVTNSCGTAADSVYYTSCPDCFVDIPNAFTPNDDGDNDILYVLGSGFTKMHLLIYNRHGEKVFETNDPSVGWNGYYKGVKQENEVYFYYFTADCINRHIVEKRGDITLIN